MILILVILFHSSGLLSQEILWEKTYDLPRDMSMDHLYGITRSEDGNLFIMYTLNDSLIGKFSPALMKVTPEGEMLWSFYKIGQNSIIPGFITEDNGKVKYYCNACSASSYSNSGYPPHIFELNSGCLAAEHYEKDDYGAQQELAGAILLTKDNILLNVSNNKCNIIVKEYDSQAIYIRQIVFDTTTFPYYPTDLFQDRDSNIYIFGNCKYKNDYKCFVIKMDRNYNILWKMADTLEEDNSLYNLVTYNEDGSFTIVSRMVPSYSSDTAKFRLIYKRYDNRGELLVNKQYYYNYRYVHLYDHYRNSDGSSLVTGYKGRSNNLYYYLMKIDSLGEILWEKTWGEYVTLNCIYAVLATEDNTIYVAGQIESVPYLACLKDGVTGIAGAAPHHNSTGRGSAYPNPVGRTITTEIARGCPGEVAVELYSIDGSFIKTLFRENMDSGNYKLCLPLPDVAPGEYSLVRRAGKEISSENIIIR